MAYGQHEIRPVLCFHECRLSLSQESEDYTSVLLDRLREWPWIGTEHLIDGVPFRVIDTPPEEGGYMLVFNITPELLVRPVLVFEGIEDQQAVLNGLTGLLELLTSHTIMVTIESAH